MIERTSSRRGEQRREVFRALSLNVLAEYMADGQRESRRVELADLSAGGAKLRTNAALPLDEPIALSLSSTRAQFRLDVSATTCWVRQESAGCWAFGCAFKPRLPETVLDELFVNHLVERRTFERLPVRFPAEARWEGSPGDHPVSLWDYSEGGFGVLSAQLAPEQCRVLLKLGQSGTPARQEVMGQARWRMQAGDGHLVGCTFINGLGYSTLQEFIERQQQPAPAGEVTTTWLPRFRRAR